MVTVDVRLPHGSYSTYTNHKCRCRECTAAARTAKYGSRRAGAS